MIQVSELLINVLNAYLALTNVTDDRIFPMIAKENVAFPFAVYGFGEVPFETKDARAFNANVTVWFEPGSITEAYKMADDLKQLADQNPWEFINTNVDFDAETGKIFSEINFKIIK